MVHTPALLYLQYRSETDLVCFMCKLVKHNVLEYTNFFWNIPAADTTAYCGLTLLVEA